MTTLVAQAPRRQEAVEGYIRKHCKEAIRQMDRYSVPASITMAQGIVETGAGRSSLAQDFNNHFGIKCHRSWSGKRTYKTDDAPNECFRSYDKWEDSYEDHSIFLKNKRYLSLYALRSDDYRGWAKGLQMAGYATDKGYANRLIQMIETYELYALDGGKYPLWMGDDKSFNRPEPSPQRRQTHRVQTPQRPIYMSYGLYYVLADPGDNLQRIADDVGASAKKLEMDVKSLVKLPTDELKKAVLEEERKQIQERMHGLLRPEDLFDNDDEDDDDDVYIEDEEYDIDDDDDEED